MTTVDGPGRRWVDEALAHGGPVDLAKAVAVGIRALGDLRELHPGVRDGALETMLRAAVSGYRAPGPDAADTPGLDAAVAAIRTACAHLATRSYEDAYLAVRAAHDHLPRLPRR